MNQNPLSSPNALRQRSATDSDKRGSILIFVVGILLLLAIVATAFLGTSRSDRTATQQNAVNTQVDLLLEGVVNAAKGQIVGDETVPGNTVVENYDAITYGNTGLPGTTDDDWLASRVPTTVDQNAAFSANAMNVGANAAWWVSVSAPVLGDASFATPYVPSGLTTPRYTAHNQVLPTFLPLNGKNYPAFQVNIAPIGVAPSYQIYLAADSDGDGIADSGLFEIPVGTLAGVTYYGAVRIIDNGSAINLNSATSRDWDFLGDGSGGYLSGGNYSGSFLANVGLAEMLRSYNVALASPSAMAFYNMSTGANNEFNELNQYRLNIAANTAPAGVLGNTSDPKPGDDLSGIARTDFQFASIGEALQNQVTLRLGNPGYTSSVGPSVGRSLFSDSLALVNRFAIPNTADVGNKLVQALKTSVLNYPSGTIPTQPYTAINSWFNQNFDFLNETAATPSTYMNRRTLLTGYSAVNNQVAPVVPPPALLFNSTAAEWAASRQVGAYPPGYPTVPMNVPTSVFTGSAGATPANPRVSMNTGRFEELFYGFFNVMARTGFTSLADDAGTPFSRFLTLSQTARTGNTFTAPTANAAPGYYYNDPYVGMSFTGAYAAGSSAWTMKTGPAGYTSVANGKSGDPEQNPLRMFRSPMRAVPDRTAPPAAGYWDAGTLRLPADQVLILRSTIAAANAEALRDSSHNPTGGNFFSDGQVCVNARITPHNVPLKMNGTYGGTNYTAAAPLNVVAHVFGLRPQPYITEVYVNTDNADAETFVLNKAGYIAVKLYNPYSFPISLKNCRLVGLRRRTDASPPVGVATQYPDVQVLPEPATPPAGENDQLLLNTAQSNIGAGSANMLPWVVPAQGTLILENYLDPASATPPVLTDVNAAGHRSTSSGMVPATGPVTPPPSTASPNPNGTSSNVNVAYVPFLETVVYDKELVLMRPLGCAPPDNSGASPLPLEYVNDQASSPEPGAYGVTSGGSTVAIDNTLAPLDSYDFTGLNYPGATNGIARTRAYAWHYMRAMGAMSGGVSNAWKFVYPGRYDANQSTVSATDPYPRQEGTQVAVSASGIGWTPTSEKDPWATAAISPAPAFLGDPVVTPTSATYLDVFTIQLNANCWPGDNPMHDPAGPVGVNLAPYGGFRRLADLLQTPFIGSYTIQTELQAVTVPATAGTSTVLEVNPVTLDAACAEDTDPYDNEVIGDNGTQSREQIGRFIPLRPTYGTATNGNPAIETSNGASPTPSYSPDNDAAFIADLTRYRDDVIDDDGRALPTTATPADCRVNRYAWTNGLFNYFTLHAPQDDYFANYPTQPKWRPGIAYVQGDTVQFGEHVFVCLAANSNATDPPGPPANPDLKPGTQSPTFPYAAGNAPTATADWLPLVRNPISNMAGASASSLPGDHSNITAGGASTAYDISDDDNENTLGIQGQVNINTAPEKVLAMIPWLQPGDNYKFDFTVYPPAITPGTDNANDNEEVARAIVQYRDGNYSNASGGVVMTHAAAPFTSIYDLYKVPLIRELQNQILLAGDPSQAAGDFSPANATADGVRYDFEEQTLLMNRVSNLITTKSDTYTLYALVQGWRDVGTDHPTLIVQRRAAYIVDRSGATAANKVLTTLSRVPTN